MSAHRTISRILALGAAFAVASLGLTGTASATTEPEDDCGYAAPVITETTLVLALDSVKAGKATTAEATVTVDGRPAREGSVTFAVAGHASQTVALSGGKATYMLPTDLPEGTYEVTADAEVPGCTQPSGATDVIVVEDDEIGGVTGQTGRAAPVTGGGWLPNVGLEAGVGLGALAGAALLAAGALLLLRGRRMTPGRHRS